MNIGLKLIRVALLYMLVGLAIGLLMAVTHDWKLLSVHSHILLLGWATMAISGIVYIVVPSCANRKLAALHFGGLNIGLPLMMVGLGFLDFGYGSAEPVVGIGSTIVLASLVVFVWNVFSIRTTPPA